MTMLLIAGLFLPLYPLSALLNAALARLRPSAMRFVMLLVWPQLGVLFIQQSAADVPPWLAAWALLSAALYALRLLTCRDLGRAAGYLATSATALTWGLAASHAEVTRLSMFAFSLSLPAALMTLLNGVLARRFGAAYAGACGGLGSALPRWSAMLAIILLAAIATPPFPGFFALLDLLDRSNLAVAIAVLTLWLIWGWGAVRLMQGFIAGNFHHDASKDMRPSQILTWGSVLLAFVGAGLYFSGAAA